MLDDLNLIANRDPRDALQVAAAQPAQATWAAQIKNEGEYGQPVETVVVAGMGGSALAAGLAKSWLRLSVPFEIIRKYDIPSYTIGKRTPKVSDPSLTLVLRMYSTKARLIRKV